MPSLSDSDVQENEHDIVAEYENRDSDGENENLQRSGDFNEEDDEANDGEGTARRIDPSTSKKHVVRNPIPKLNAERLKGPKGIHTIEKYFEGFKFHGKGHEKSDLARVMKRMEHWAHRLFPKLDFDDFLAKLEKLGPKRELQTFITRYRNDEISTEGDANSKEFVEEEQEKEDDEPIDEFDMLIAEQIEKQKQVASQDTSICNTSTDNVQANNDKFDQLFTNTINKTAQAKKESAAPSQLSDEVREKIERNRQEAIKRRLARLEALKESPKQRKLENSESMQELKANHSSNVTEPGESNK